jgi:glyceraldehyde 3-phosphate dehydrogenase
MTTRIAINGFGRIGRSFYRALLQREQAQDLGVEVVAINDLGGPAELLDLLRFDSNLGPLRTPATLDDSTLVAGGQRSRLLSERDPGQLPWAELGVDVVVESTGRFSDAHQAAAHLQAGAGRVLVSAPAQGDDLTVVMGVNDHLYDPSKHRIVSNGSCTTNCLAPMAQVLHDGLGIEHGMMTTVHAYTQDQNLQDGPHRDRRRARAAATNIVPTTTGAAKAIGRVLPELDGRLDGYSLRVPVPVGSITDLTVRVARSTTVEEVNTLFAKAANDALAGILRYSEDPLVSRDIVGDPASCVFDAPLTKVIGDGRQVKVFGWYDNESGFSHRLIDTVLLMAGHAER